MSAGYDEVLISIGLTPSARRQSAECGTRSGYNRHRRNNEEPCAPCRAANAEYSRRWVQAPKQPHAMPPINHGTPGGARQHWVRRERPCESCAEAYYAVVTPRKRAGWARRKQVAA